MPRLVLLIGLLVTTTSVTGATDVLFEKDIRPILKAHCFQCHGEDDERESELDLRLRRLIIKGGDSGPAIEPGDPDGSLILQRIVAQEMPPGDKTLSAQEVKRIRQWIEQGAHTARDEPDSIGDHLVTAEEQQFWAFQPIERPALPMVRGVDAIESPIDSFILAKLEASDLSFSPAADRTTLVRRLYFDLLGLPPSPESIDAFLSDDAENATERLIDSLLASPQYSERWARHWLDVAGYADSEGYAEEDRIREWAFPYRDYVIRSLNDDKPIDQFICEQLAGDEMISPPYNNMTADEIEKLTATGFLRMAPDGTASGGIDQNLARNQTIADTIDIVSTSLLGMTMGCARCHNHRYDPISQVDYYRMRAIFEPALNWKSWRNPSARRISLYTDAERELKKQIEAEAAKVEQQRKAKTDFYIDRTLEEELATLDEALRDLLRVAYKTAAGERTEEQKRLLKEHPSVQNISPGSLYLYDRRRDEQARKVDAERKEKAKQLIAQTREKALAEVPAELRPTVLAVEKVDAAKLSGEQRALREQYAAVFVTEATLAQFNPQAATELQADRDRAAELRATKTADDLKSYSDRIAAIRKRSPPERFVRALTERPGRLPETFVFHRGDHEQPRQQVEPGEPVVFARAGNSISGKAEGLSTSGRRLAYAQALTSGDHPLVARVIVNRVWAHHFGRGIVGSLGDFGALGDRPTHGKLLDWLASELTRSGWQLKRLHRLIVSSAAYRQSAFRSEQLDRVDPDNRLYGRMSVRRLESEVVRDAVLEISGQLNRQMFGPPVPVMEDEVGQIVIGREMLDGERKPQKGDGLGGQEARRSLYVQIRRSRPLAVLETFDAPRMTPNCTERNASNVAPQSLLMMNSDFAIRHARRLAERVVAEVGADRPQQIKRAWKLALGMQPSEDDMSSAEAYLDRQAGALKKKEDALVTLCHALISTNRFLYID
jgi:hypothetical protein